MSQSLLVFVKWHVKYIVILAKSGEKESEMGI